MTDSVLIRVGDRAIATTILSPGGFIVVAGRQHSARSIGQIIERDTEVIILRGDHSGFVVQPVAEIGNPETVRNFGQPVFSSFGHRVISEEILDREARSLAWRRFWKRTAGLVVGGLLSVVLVLLATWVLM